MASPQQIRRDAEAFLRTVDYLDPAQQWAIMFAKRNLGPDPQPTATYLTAILDARASLRSGEFRRLRRDAKLSLNEVAGYVGVTSAAIGHWELGKRRPSDSYVKKIIPLLQMLRRECG